MYVYGIQTVFISLLLSIAYFLLFRNSKQLVSRRALLLVIPLLSIIIPFSSNFHLFDSPIDINSQIINAFNTINIGDFNEASINSETSNATYYLYFYVFISLILLLKLIFQILSIFVLRKKSERKEEISIIENTHNSFSFFHLIFVPKSQLDNLDIIVDHEMIHIKQKHSFDIVYFEILKALFWFNPVFYILKKEITKIHEFLVDDSLISYNTDIEKYCNLILLNTQMSNMIIGNNFNNSLTKNRFLMITKSKSKRWMLVKVLIMIVVLFTIVFSFQSCSQKEDEKSIPKTVLTKAADLSSDTTLVSPKFVGGTEEYVKFIRENAKYPSEAREDSIEGIVYISALITKEGKLTNIKVKRGLSPETNAEAIRVVSLMPDFIPAYSKGKAIDFNFYFPIKFKLN